MDTEAKREVARRFLTEIWSKGDMEVVDELCAPGFAFVLSFARTGNVEQFKQIVTNSRAAFEGLTYVPGEIVIEGNHGAATWTMSGKHVNIWSNIPATNKDVSIQGISFYYFNEAGMLDKVFVENDVIGLMRQLDAITMKYA